MGLFLMRVRTFLENTTEYVVICSKYRTKHIRTELLVNSNWVSECNKFDRRHSYTMLKDCKPILTWDSAHDYVVVVELKRWRPHMLLLLSRTINA